jgi:uncharacterized repeat protein (TIGR01451 family)
MTTFKRLLLLVPVVLVLVPASALAGSGPQWTVTAYSTPTNLAPGATGAYKVTVTNTGGAASDGSTITVADTLPAGLKLGAGGVKVEGSEIAGVSGSCADLTCEFSGAVVAGNALLLSVPVEAEAAAPSTCPVPAGATSCVTNVVTVSGGGAAAASATTPTTISPEPAKWGVAPGSVVSVLSSTQAGAHADLTTSLAFDTVPNPLGEPTRQGPFGPEPTGPVLAGNPRGQVDDLPPGFAGDLADTPTCPIALFSQEKGGNQTGVEAPFFCPLSTQVGTILLRLIEQDGSAHDTFLAPVFNLAPNPGEVAKLGFFAGVFQIQGEVFLRPGDDGIRTSFLNDPDNVVAFESFQLTIWGVPAEPANDVMRGLYCENQVGHCYGQGKGGLIGSITQGAPSTSPRIPYLTNPTQCTGNPLQAQLTVSSWETGNEPQSVPANTGTLTGCDLLEFKPSITAAPDTTNADTPAGLTADVKVPQEGLTNAEGLSAADLQNTTVTLPAGVAINPGQAAGLAACQSSEEEIGVSAPTKCPNASIVGHAEVRTPLLKEKLEGDVYVLQSNPPDVKLLVEIAQPIYGIYIKLIGDVHLNTTTGQLTTTFEGTPQLPFSDFRLSFSGGAQAALSTPTGCGVYTTNAGFTPWTAPIEPEALSTSEFAITAGTDGAPCPSSPLPFNPSLTAGATTDQAGGYTHFSLLLQSADDQQRISKLQFKAPAGLSGMISTVPLCGEPQAAQGTCPSASQIGHTVVASGPGPYPLVVPQPGQPPAAIYLTGPYEGAPFGLSIVVPVVVGPFVLQTQVVRAKIEVDPHTAQITVTTNPLPQIIDGVPTDLRTVNAVIDREGFMFNPTNCSPQSFSGTATSAQGATAPISSHFQVGSCQSLKFAPDLKVATSGKTSKADGASLEAKIVYPTGALGDNQATSQANIAKVKVDLPKQLPSRLTTLQKACTAAQFNANPAGCPAASVIGHATALTPELPVPLTGPAYFVSNGGEAFPNLEIVLQGDNVKILLVADTFISKAGITSSTFNTVPDAPVTTFTLTLPEGKYSALAANGNLCTSKLAMPTEFTGQNGLKINRSTAISVSGCGKTKALTRAQKLKAALAACHKEFKHSRARRQQCEKAARKRFGAHKKARKKGRR